MKRENNATAAHVAAYNLAGALANQLQTSLTHAFRPLVGKKVLKVDGDLTEQANKIFKAVAIVPENAYVHLSRGGSYLCFIVRVTCGWGLDSSVPVERWQAREGQKYAETGFGVGTIKENILVECEQKQERPHRTDYTEAEVRAARERVHAATEAKREAEHDLCPFDLYEN